MTMWNDSPDLHPNSAPSSDARVVRRALLEVLGEILRAVPLWGGFGALLIVLHRVVVLLFGLEAAERLGLLQLLIEASRLGALVTLGFVLATLGWAFYAWTHWTAILTRLETVTVWLLTTSAIAVAVLFGLCVGILIPLFGDAALVDLKVLAAAIGAMFLLVLMNVVIATTRSFSQDPDRIKLGSMSFFSILAIVGWEALRRIHGW